MTGKCVAHGRQHGASAQSVPRNILQNKGATMNTQADDIILTYPDEPLGNQVRDINDTLSAFAVANEVFFADK